MPELLLLTIIVNYNCHDGIQQLCYVTTLTKTTTNQKHCKGS